MNFKAEKRSLVLELENIDGEKKAYDFRGKVCAVEVDKVMREWELYEQAQGSLPASERDSQHQVFAKGLKIAFPELEIDWLLENFVLSDLSEMIKWTASEMSGLKKKEKS